MYYRLIGCLRTQKSSLNNAVTVVVTDTTMELKFMAVLVLTVILLLLDLLLNSLNKVDAVNENHVNLIC